MLLISVMSRGDRVAVFVFQERLQVPCTEESSEAISDLFLKLSVDFTTLQLTEGSSLLPSSRHPSILTHIQRRRLMATNHPQFFQVVRLQ